MMDHPETRSANVYELIEAYHPDKTLIGFCYKCSKWIDPGDGEIKSCLEMQNLKVIKNPPADFGCRHWKEKEK